MVWLGTSGYVYPHWARIFYEGVPQRLWLQHYARVFRTVELNNTFYPGVRLSFSIGHATCVQGERLTDAVKVADSRMYEAKRAHYEALGKERRREN